MKLWNVFRMEIFKNLHDHINLFVMIVLMCFNIIGGIAIGNHFWSDSVGPLVMLGWLSIICSLIFIFVYPYRLAQVDYKNKVISTMIASGVSRVQYYFVKVSATLLFSFVSVLLLAFIPMLIVTNISWGDFYLTWSGAWLALSAWLSTFFTLMTAIIIVKGKGVAIFVFFGLNLAATTMSGVIRAIFNINNHLFLDDVAWIRATTIENFITMAVFGIIGIFILHKQDL